MIKYLSNPSFHSIGGAFGKVEQHCEYRFHDLIEEISQRACGYMTPVSRFTKNTAGYVDSKIIKRTVMEILSTCKEFNTETEREFYSSFFYCALALISVEFQYFYKDKDPFFCSIQVHNMNYHGSSGMDFRFLAENAQTTRGAEGIGLTVGTAYSFFIPELYSALTGKDLPLKTVDDDFSRMERQIRTGFLPQPIFMLPTKRLVKIRMKKRSL